MNRREFLKLGVVVTGTIIAPGCTFETREIKNGVRSSIELALDPRYKQSIKNVTEIEVKNFIDIYLQDGDDFGEVVSKLTGSLTGVIGTNELSTLYLNHYSTLENPPDHIRKRLAIYHSMDTGYSHKGGKYKQIKDVVFSKRFYYGSMGEGNIKGTTIDLSLKKYIDNGEIDDKGKVNHVFIRKVDGLQVFLYYGASGALEIASYTSTGSPQSDGGSYTKKYSNQTIVGRKDKYHISGSYPSPGYGAPMAFSVNVAGAIWIHVGDVTGSEDSHGCIRLPFEYASRFYTLADSQTTITHV